MQGRHIFNYQALKVFEYFWEVSLWWLLNSGVPHEYIFSSYLILEFLVQGVKYALIVEILILAVRQDHLIQLLYFLENIQRNYGVALLVLVRI